MKGIENLIERYGKKSKDVRRILEEQYKIYKSFKDSDIKNTFLNLINEEENDLILKENTLLHGTRYDEKKLNSIKENGILSGEVFVEEEDEETNACADFYRVEENQNILDFSDREMGRFFHDVNEIVPLSKTFTVHKPGISEMAKRDFLAGYGENSNITFIIDSNVAEIFQKYDYYRQNENKDIIGQIINTQAVDIFFKKNKMSSPLIGIPFNAISACVVGLEIEKDDKRMKFINDTFGKDIIILSIDGRILSMPELENINLNDFKDRYNKQLIEKKKNLILENNITLDSLKDDRIKFFFTEELMKEILDIENS